MMADALGQDEWRVYRLLRERGVRGGIGAARQVHDSQLVERMG